MSQWEKCPREHNSAAVCEWWWQQQAGVNCVCKIIETTFKNIRNCLQNTVQIKSMDRLCGCRQLCCWATRYITFKKRDIVCYPPGCTSLQQLLHMSIKKCFRHLYGKHLVQIAVCLMDLGQDITLEINVCKQYASQYWLGNKSHSWQLWIAFVSLSVEMNFTQKLTLTPVLPRGLDSLLSFADTYTACRTIVTLLCHIA